MTLTSEVVFSIEIVSLPVGGMITRIACGSTIRRMIRMRFIPSACAASVWPWSTEMMPARTISDMYAPSFSPSPRIAAVNVVMTVFELPLKKWWPNGTPIDRCLYSTPTLFQNSSWTSTGVPRKTQM